MRGCDREEEVHARERGAFFEESTRREGGLLRQSQFHDAGEWIRGAGGACPKDSIAGENAKEVSVPRSIVVLRGLRPDGGNLEALLEFSQNR